MQIHPTGHRVLVRLKKTDKKETEVSKGGIILELNVNVESHQRAMQEAYVVELGRNAFKDFGDGHLWATEGQLVLISRYCGEDRVGEDGVVFRIINDVDILAVLED